jgi:hypothetical protein
MGTSVSEGMVLTIQTVKQHNSVWYPFPLETHSTTRLEDLRNTCPIEHDFAIGIVPAIRMLRFFGAANSENLFKQTHIYP